MGVPSMFEGDPASIANDISGANDKPDNPGNSYLAGSPGIATHMFEPYQQYIPEAMNSNQPIYDPTSILRAYAQNMPAFLSASRPPEVPTINASSSLSTKQQSK